MKIFVIAVCLIGLAVAFPGGDIRRGGQGTRPNLIKRLGEICRNADFTSESQVTEDEFDLQTALTEVCDYIRTVIEQNEDDGEEEVETATYGSTTEASTTQAMLRELLGDIRRGGQGTRPNIIKRLGEICRSADFTSESLVTEGEFDLQAALTKVCDYIRTVRIEQNEDDGEEEVETTVTYGSTTEASTTQATLRELLARIGMFRKNKNKGSQGENEDMAGDDKGTIAATRTVERFLKHVKKGGRNGSGEKGGKKRPGWIKALLSVCNDLDLEDEEEGARAITTKDEFKEAMQLICEAAVKLDSDE